MVKLEEFIHISNVKKRVRSRARRELSVDCIIFFFLSFLSSIFFPPISLLHIFISFYSRTAICVWKKVLLLHLSGSYFFIHKQFLVIICCCHFHLRSYYSPRTILIIALLLFFSEQFLHCIKLCKSHVYMPVLNVCPTALIIIQEFFSINIKYSFLLLLNDASADIHNLSISLFKVILKANTHSLLTVRSFLSLLFLYILFFFILYVFIYTLLFFSWQWTLQSVYINMSIYALDG